MRRFFDFGPKKTSFLPRLSRSWDFNTCLARRVCGQDKPKNSVLSSSSSRSARPGWGSNLHLGGGGSLMKSCHLTAHSKQPTLLPSFLPFLSLFACRVGVGVGVGVGGVARLVVPGRARPPPPPWRSLIGRRDAHGRRQRRRRRCMAGGQEQILSCLGKRKADFSALSLSLSLLPFLSLNDDDKGGEEGFSFLSSHILPSRLSPVWAAVKRDFFPSPSREKIDPVIGHASSRDAQHGR